MKLREHMQLLENLGKEFQQKLNGINANDTAAVARLEVEFHEQILGAGKECQPKVRIIPHTGGSPRLEWE